MLDSLLAALGFMGDVLDTPGSWVRNALSGENPFKGTFDPEQRTSGRRMLEKLGLVGENTDGLDLGDVGGFLAEMALDPTNLIGAGAAARTAKAARAAKAANAESHALRAAGAMPEEIARLTKIVDETGAPKRMYHGTAGAFDKFDSEKLDPASLFGPGVYTTDSPHVAETYATGRAPTVSDVTVDYDKAIPLARAYVDAEGGHFRRDVRDYVSGHSDEGIDVGKIMAMQDSGAITAAEANALRAMHAPPNIGEWMRVLDLQSGSDDDMRRLIDGALAKMNAKSNLSALEVQLGMGVMDRAADVHHFRNYGANIRPHYLDVRNPLKLDVGAPLDVPVDPGFIQDVMQRRRRNAQDLVWKVRSARRSAAAEANPETAKLFAASAEDFSRQLRDALSARSSPPTMDEFYRNFGHDGVKDAGFDGITHRGGIRVGGAGEHNVAIALSPDQVYLPMIAPEIRDVPSAKRKLAALLGYNAGMFPERFDDGA